MEDLYEARNSRYCYKDTDVLVNKLNIKNNNDLFLYESKITMAKAFDLRQKGIIGNFDIKHLSNIHKYLFEDIYPFAGKLRRENIAKDVFRFAEWSFIEDELKLLLNRLKEENYLKGKTKEELADKLAYYMAELNVLHPFREGNGRTIREFIRELALYNGYLFNVKEVKSEDLLEASIRSVVDTTNLSKLVYKCLSEERRKKPRNEFIESVKKDHRKEKTIPVVKKEDRVVEPEFFDDEDLLLF